MGEGNAKDITLGEGVTTISLDDEKIGYAGKLLSIEIVKKANVLFLDYSDRKLTHCINKYAIAMLRGEKS